MKLCMTKPQAWTHNMDTQDCTQKWTYSLVESTQFQKIRVVFSPCVQILLVCIMGFKSKQSEPEDWRSGKGPVAPAVAPAVAPKKVTPLGSKAAAVVAPKSAGRRTETTRIANGNLALPYIPEKLSDESQKTLDGLLEAISGTAWLPMIDTSAQGWDPSCGSFFGGNSVCTTNQTWPVCIACKVPLAFVCQIDRSTLLHPLQGSGLVQVFACTKCANLRKSAWATVTAPGTVLSTPGFAFPLRRIVKWLPRKDYAHPDDYERRLTREEWTVLAEVQIRSDKIGGFPVWLQQTEPRPTCNLCHKGMRLLVQIDSGDNVPFVWGGIDGCIMVFECQTHTEQVHALLMH